MMELQTTRNKDDECFDDMFRNCRQYIIRVDELHSDPENDAVFVFIVWVTWIYSDKAFNILFQNIKPQAHITRLDENLFAISEQVC